MAQGTRETPVRAGDRNRLARELFAPLPSRYDLLAEVLSLGQNGRWRRAMVDRVRAGRSARVLDVATGTAGVALELTRRTAGDVTGIDLSETMLRRGRANVARAGGRVRLLLGRAEELPFPDATFDAVTFTYLLRYVEDPAATLRELARVLKPGAPMASLEFCVPTNPVWLVAWWGYTRLVLPVAGALTGGRAWWRVGRFLGPSISEHYRHHPVASTVRSWQEAGLADVGVQIMSLGGGLVMWATKRDG